MASSSSGPSGLKIEAVSSSGGGTGGGEASEAAVSGSDQLFVYRGLKKAKKERGCTAKERISKMPPCAAGKRSSIYRGVTRHRWTGRYEAHLWDKSTWNQNQNKKGKQVYLGAYDEEEAAARAYDLAALKYWGPGTLINFPVSDYSRDLEEMKNVTREDYLASLRRKSSGFSRGISKYRGLPSGRWDPSCGRMAGSDHPSSSTYYPDASAESEYAAGFCIERKIDLTPYIKWWGSSKINKSTEETKHGHSDDIGTELKMLESSIQHSEPYQMPRLGVIQDTNRNNKGSVLSAMSVLSQSVAFKNLQEKATKMKETAASLENDENEKDTANKSNYGKAIEKQPSCPEGVSGFASEAGQALTLDRSVYPLSPLLSAAPLLTNYSGIDPLPDSIPWTTLVPVLSTGLPQVTKTETSTNYAFFQQEQ